MNLLLGKQHKCEYIPYNGYFMTCYKSGNVEIERTFSQFLSYIFLVNCSITLNSDKNSLAIILKSV